MQLLVLQPKAHWLFSSARNACFSQDCPTCSKRSSLLAPPLIRYRFCGITGCSVSGNSNQSTGWVPLLQEVVPTPSPTDVPLVPNWTTLSTIPTMTSGPFTSVGVLGPPARSRGGMTTDLGSPLANWVISIGCIAAPTEIFPTIAPASDGRPSALANSFETRSRPLVILSDCASAL